MASNLQLICFFLVLFHKTGNCAHLRSPFWTTSKIIDTPLPIETVFKLPSPVPTWPPGGAFANGTIDLGGLLVYQISSFTKIWATNDGGPDNLGATFFEPNSVPDGFFTLGYYAQPNNKPLFGWVLAGKDVTGNLSGGALKLPIDYTLVWSSEGNGYIWLPTPPEGYEAVGHVVTTSPEKPPLDKIRCVRSDFTDLCQTDSWIWGQDHGFNVYALTPTTRGIQAQGLSAGTFTAQSDGAPLSTTCLKNVQGNLSSSMPNLSQILALVQAYSPWIYFHPDEQFLPSSVSWFFENGALLYTSGNESNPVAIEPTGSNLPPDGSNDGAYWLDLPADQAAKEQVKKGNLQDAGVYLHVKPMLGGTCTDIAVWVFYPFNGAAKAKIELINVSLGKIGEHVGDWEHVTLRISNFDGELKSVYFSQHSAGIWVSASELEYFQGDNKPVIYSALHSHAACPKAGLTLQGSGGGIGIRMDTAKGANVMDTGERFLAVAAEYLGLDVVVEPPWLKYAREWGPKVEYNVDEELKELERFMVGKLKTQFKKVIASFPKEVLGEEGPTGPKMKESWSADEKI